MLPCTSSSAGALVLLDNGELLIAVHVMLVALSVEVTFILKVDMVMPFDASTEIACDMLVPIPLLSFTSTPLASQTNPLATPVQLSSATPLIETLTDCGGMMIPVQVNVTSDHGTADCIS